jgi:hypothetical protein
MIAPVTSGTGTGKRADAAISGPILIAAAAAAAVAALLALGPGPAQAAGDAPVAPASDDEAPRPAAEAEPARPPSGSAPRLQIDSDSPEATAARDARMSAARADAVAEERPFWKNWIFWTVAGVLVVAGVSLAVYSLSGGSTSLGPCPTDVALSLGCYGTDRGR